MLGVAVLAAGESRRMGQSKALLPYRGRTFLEHLLEVTKHPRVGWIRVVLGAQADEILAKIHLPPQWVVLNRRWERGQLSSIQAAIRSLPRGGSEGLLLCPVDQPLVSRTLIGQLIEAFENEGAAIIIPTFHGRRGHPVIFRSTLYQELLAAPVEVGARAVVWAHAGDVLEVPTEEEGVVLNLNDPATLERALKTS